MAVRTRPPVTRHVLDDRQHAAVQHPVDHRLAERRYDPRIAPERTIADDVVRTFDRHVDARHAIDVDAEIVQLRRHHTRVVIRKSARRPRILPAHRAEHRRRRALAPMFAAQPLHAPAFLVDQDRRVGAPDRGAQRRGQTANLVRRTAVAGEQNEAPRLHRAEKRLFRRGQLVAIAAENYRSNGHGMPTPHCRGT